VAAPDSTTYVYTLRPGVQFSDGHPMTAEDVAFSLNRHMTPASYWGLWYANVNTISASGPLEITVKLKKADVLFNEMMSTPAGYVGEEKFIKAAGTNYGTPSGGVMCTGPFTLQKWSQGSSIVLAHNTSYWDASLQPKAAQFQFSFITDDSTLTNALLTGSIDGSWEPPVAGLARLRSSGVGTVYLNTGPLVAAFQLSSLTGALKDVRIRRALKALIDYNGIVKVVLGGAGTPETSITPSDTWGYASSTFADGHAKLRSAAQDLGLAKQLLAQAGIPTQPIVIAVNADNHEMVQTVTAIQDSARQLGLQITLRSLPTATYNNLFFDAKARAGIDAMMSFVTVDIPDPLELYIQVIPGLYDYDGYADQAFLGPITEATGVSDPTNRAQLVVQAQATYINDVAILPVYASYVRLFMNKRITGPAVSVLGYLYYPWAATVGAP